MTSRRLYPRRFAWHVLMLTLTGCVIPEEASRPRPRFEVMEATILELQVAMREGEVTSRELVLAYLARIEAYDQQGPRLNSILSLNPQALAQADALDRERQEKGPRGPLHGVPIVLKDNYDTVDLPTTGGSLALVDHRPPDDGFQVQKLRDAGAVIVGKTNMHELAAGITTIGSLGGQTRNPYDPERNPGGSSGGTGAAVAASFAAVGMGSDTCGSIRIPSSHNNLFGLRPTRGLSSIDGIIPLSHTQDVAGPLARTVTDLAIVLDATVGEDAADPTTHVEGDRPSGTFMEALRPDALEGSRVGVLVSLFGEGEPEDPEVDRIVRAAIENMKENGAVVEEVSIPDLSDLMEGGGVINHEFKFDLMDYLAASPHAPVSSLEEILRRGLFHERLKDTFERRNSINDRDSKEYREALGKRGKLQTAVVRAMSQAGLDVLAYPTIRTRPALIGQPQRGSTCRLSAISGLPAISIPAGFTEDELPVGVELLGPPFGDHRLVALAYAFEQRVKPRRAPFYTPPLTGGAAPPFSVKTAVRAVGDTMVPPVTTSASATIEFRFNPATRDLSYAITLHDLAWEQVVAMQIHRASAGSNGPVIWPLKVIAENGMATGSVHFTNQDRVDLIQERLYVTLATQQHPAGELRAQLFKARQ